MLTAALLLTAGSGCGDAGRKPVDVAAGIPPIADLAQRIAGSGVMVRSALPQGRSPHDFAPKPGDVRDIAGARVFLHSGMPFEKSFLRALGGSGCEAVDVTRGIVRMQTESGCDEDHHHEEGDDHGHGHDLHDDALDPHVWLSPENCMVIVRNIADALIGIMPERRSEFERNLRSVSSMLRTAKEEMTSRLDRYRGRTFLVYHPAFGYFAASSGLKQRSIELSGREPSPAQLAEIIRTARANRIKTVFVQPQFNPATARSLAAAIDGEVVEIDPLDPDVIANFRRLTEHIERGFRAHD